MDNGDSFKKVRSGEPMVIPAAAWNAMLDALAWVNQQRKVQASGQDVIDQRCVLVRNDSGTNLPAQCVLGVSGVVFDPAAGGNALASFKADPVLIGDLPSVADRAGKFVILAAPINDGEIGLAWASGTCAVKVNITDASHPFADVYDGGVSYLASGSTGAVAILWKAAATGNVWCVIRFGGAGGQQQSGGANVFVARVVSGTSGTYTVVAQTLSGGSLVDTGGNLTAYDLSDGPVDAGQKVVVVQVGTNYYFDHPVYAKYMS